MIRFNQVGKRYGDKWSLQPFDGEIASGKIIALCGSNGAGKSTLLNVLNGTLQPSVGEVLIGEVSPKQRRRYNATFGYMPDDFSFDPSWTVQETFGYYAYLQGGRPDSTYLARVGLNDRSRLRVSELSKGMRQRLLLAQALVTQPDVLLLDEPTNGLDPIWMQTLRHLLRDEANRGATIIFSTHQLDVATLLADEVWTMEAGTITGKILVEDERQAYEELRRFFFGSEQETCQMDIAPTK
ncbi:ABC transporter ATP-binding protein [Exiguobacterium algae]|uniref:ABC transporter ATP-binding protein n=1 Tax=Exiguobacterium algae TaxID=2751250 RepID=UPI001BE935C5|nr:ABC transporter ATP-binding protein [Exiguobacterium algae]